MIGKSGYEPYMKVWKIHLNFLIMLEQKYTNLVIFIILKKMMIEIYKNQFIFNFFLSIFYFRAKFHQ
jgi:hypothetical protein